MNENKKISIGEFFIEGRAFIIPSYQRGYKWAEENEKGESSVKYFCDSLRKAWNEKLEEYFIEAVTIVKTNEEFILVDGQQRTTTLYLLFQYLENNDSRHKIELKYNVREDSERYLRGETVEDEDIQDVFFFKEAKRIMDVQLLKDNLDKNDFSKFILNNVKLLVNEIPKDKALTAFISLNGLKAIMKDEELIKSDLLIKSSRESVSVSANNIDASFNLIKDIIGKEWKINEDRGRLARNWDKWLYWWNQKEVKDYFGTGNRHPLFYLLVTFWNINKPENEKKTDWIFNFDSFKSKFISDHIKAKFTFEELRKLQKSFEDLYNEPISYNFLGIILKTSQSKEDALSYFLNTRNKSGILIEEYAKWSLVGATHIEIVDNTKEKIEDSEEYIFVKERKVRNAIDLIGSKYVYWDENDNEFNDERKEYAFKFLLLLNVLKDTDKFDFSIWGNRSLEHIFPKSWQKDPAKAIDFSASPEVSEHCIGNLVLLYGANNSTFGAEGFEKKKSIFFDVKKDSFKSRNLLHTISVFAKSKWDIAAIKENQQATIQKIEEYYGIK